MLCSHLPALLRPLWSGIGLRTAGEPTETEEEPPSSSTTSLSAVLLSDVWVGVF